MLIWAESQGPPVPCTEFCELPSHHLAPRMGTMCLAHCPMQRENLEILNGDSWSVVIKAIKFAWTWIMKVPTSYHSFDDLILGGISFLCEMSFFWGFMHKSNRLCWKGIDSEGKFKLRNKGIKRQKWDLIPKLHFYVYSVLIYSIAKNVLEATKCHSGGNQPVTSGSCRNKQPASDSLVISWHGVAMLPTTGC